MKIEITDPGEIHLLLVEKYQQSSVNIVIRAVIDNCYPNEIYNAALHSLVRSHPFLAARYTSSIEGGVSRYYYEELDVDGTGANIIQSNDSVIEQTMQGLSAMRSFLFNHESGVLYSLNVNVGESKSMLELTCPHVLGEIPSIILLMGELLGNIDQLVRTGKSRKPKNEKYFFNENDFSWSSCEYEDLNFDAANVAPLEKDPWILPEATLVRHKLDSIYFKQIKTWLLNGNINATASDVFYYVAHQVLTEMLGGSPNMWLILSYRNQAKTEEVKNSCYNFAFFAPVNTSIFDDSGDKAWLESMCKYRQTLVTREGVCATRNFFYSLNKAMEGKDVCTGKSIMDSLVKFPDFAFNNFGMIDPYVGTHESFNVIDFDVQDGTPVQEIRYFTLGDTFYINPTFFDESGIDVSKFWSEFEVTLMRIVG